MAVSEILLDPTEVDRETFDVAADIVSLLLNDSSTNPEVSQPHIISHHA